jgi:hypothetical protein
MIWKVIFQECEEKLSRKIFFLEEIKSLLLMNTTYLTIILPLQEISGLNLEC